MRSRQCCIALVVLMVISCQSPSHRNVAWSGAAVADSLSSSIRGIYNGHLKEGLVTLVINYVSDSAVSGYDIHRGLRRNVNGTLQQKGGAVDFVLKEPGNNPLDGTFYLSVDTASHSITGNWVPQDSAKIHSGPLDLKKWKKDTGVDVEGARWMSDLGTLFLNENGSCTISISGRGGEDVIWGIYTQKGKTIFIEWEPNNKLPKRKMKLVRKGYTADDQDSGQPVLEGDGVKFEESIAG